MHKLKLTKVHFLKIFSVKKKLKVFLPKAWMPILLSLPFLALLTCNTTEPTDDNNGQDTTSHNFTFQSWTFGEHSSSVLYDVAIIDENNIWAVGEIYMNDSLGNPDPHAYNAMHWDGHSWALKRIYFPTVCGSLNFTPYPAKAIYPFINGEIWIGSTGDKIVTLIDSIQSNQFCLPSSVSMSINRFWGINSANLFVVGNNGNIAHYNGTIWQKIESRTELNIYDIYGQKTTNGEYEIICVAADISKSNDKKIFKIVNNMVEDLPTAGIPSSVTGIWFRPGEKYYVVGSGMFTKTDVNSNFGWESIWQGITEYYTGSIDGNDLNDIVVCGAYGELLHYNGAGWKSYHNELQLQTGSYSRIKIKGNLIIAVGSNSSKAILTIGRRKIQ